MKIYKKGAKKLLNAWAFYDWANSVYPLVITTAIFPIFYESYVSEEVLFFGTKWISTALITVLSASYFLLLVLTLPFLTGNTSSKVDISKSLNLSSSNVG